MLRGSVLDVIVVGAGPAGLYAALILAEEGFDVAVLEEHDDIGAPIHCTGVISDEVSNLFKVSESLVLNRPRVCRVVGPSGRAVPFAANGERVAVIDRGQFDLELSSAARQAGAEIRTGFRVDRVASHARSIAVSGTRGQQAEARACILAGGVSYGLQRQLGLPLPSLVLPSAQLEVDAADGPDSAVELHVGTDTAPGGFAWLVPVVREERRRLKVGVMARGNATDHLGRFLSRPMIRERLAAEPGAPVRRLLPLGPSSKTYAHRVLTVGDAAGLTKPTTGGGIFYALLSASIAAETLGEALRRDQLSEERLGRYERLWRTRLNTHLRLSTHVRCLFTKLTDAEIETVLEAVAPDDVQEVIRRTARFNWHGGMIRSILRQRGIRSVLLQALLR
jgi:digeranylgeranylglycerophospholipid reductase